MEETVYAIKFEDIEFALRTTTSSPRFTISTLHYALYPSNLELDISIKHRHRTFT